MPLTTPTTKDISDNIINQLQATLNQTIPLLPKAFNRVLAKVLAAVFILLYKYAGWMFLQLFIRTASFEETEIYGIKIRPLIEWGRLIGIGDPELGLQSELLTTVTVENQTGSIPAGTALFSAVNGITYLLLDTVILDAPTKLITIRAQSDVDGNLAAGTVGNLEPGDTVSFVNPLENVARDTIVDSVAVSGTNAETGEEYRQRAIDRFQKRPQGGAGVDYEIWGEEVSGIINIFPYTGDEGFVDVYAEANTDIDPDGIPTPSQLEAVEYAIIFDESDKQTRKPIGPKLNVLPITRTAINVKVYNLEVDDPGTVQLDIETSLKSYFLGRSPYIVGVTVLPRKDQIKRTDIISIINDIVSSAGGTFTDVAIYLDAIPDPIFIVGQVYILQEGEKSKLGTLEFIVT